MQRAGAAVTGPQTRVRLPLTGLSALTVGLRSKVVRRTEFQAGEKVLVAVLGTACEHRRELLARHTRLLHGRA